MINYCIWCFCSFIFTIPMSQTISVINRSGACYFLHASNQWCLCWRVPRNGFVRFSKSWDVLILIKIFCFIDIKINMTANTKASVLPEEIEFCWFHGLSLSRVFCIFAKMENILMNASPSTQCQGSSKSLMPLQLMLKLKALLISISDLSKYIYCSNLWQSRTEGHSQLHM